MTSGEPLNLRDPRNFKAFTPELRDVIRMGGELGWHGKRSGSGGVSLYSPNGRTIVGVPAGRQDRRLARTLGRQVAAASDKDALDTWMTEQERKGRQAAVAGDRHAIDEILEGIHAVDHTEQVVSGAFGLLPEHIMGTSTDPTIVSVVPWQAIGATNYGKGAGKYESKAVNERRWSNGTTDYVCTFEGCEYTSGNPRSVSSHRSVHRAGLSTQNPIVVIDPNAAHTERRVARLAREIENALAAMDAWDMATISASDLAKALAGHIIERRTEHDQEMEAVKPEPEPLTPEGMLDQIRALLVKDVLVKVAALEGVNNNLLTQLGEVEHERDVALATARRKSEALATLAEMAAGEGKDDGEDTSAGVESGDATAG